MWLLGFLLYFMIFQIANTKRSYTIEILTYEHKYSSDFYSLLDYKLIKLNKLAMLNGLAFLRREIDEIAITIVAHGIRNGRNKNLKIFELKADVCKLLDTNRKRPLNMAYYHQQPFAKHGHLLPEKCPYKTGVDYNVLNLYFNSEDFPLYMPQLMMNVNIWLHRKNFEFYTGNMTIAIVSKIS